MPRKKRSDSILAHLPLDQQRQISDWMFAGMSYDAIVEELQSRYEVKTSPNSLSDFWHSFCAPELLRRRKHAVTTAEALAEEAAQNPGQWDTASIEALKERVFDMMTRPGSDPKDIQSLFKLVLSSRKQDLEERRIELLEQKAKQADHAKAINEDQTITPEEQQKRIQQIFRMG